MRNEKVVVLFLLFIYVSLVFPCLLLPEQIQPVLSQPTLRLLTINVWSGLDYKGTLRFGAYEPRQKRQARYDSLLAQIRELDPDVVFLQEANPAAGFSARLARDLGFSHCHQVCIGGIKLGPFGIPANCKEGNAILARKSLRLQKLEDWKLSGSFGLFGDALTVHFDQAIFAMWARIFVDDRPIHLVNVHLVAVPPGGEPSLAADWETVRLQENMPEKEYLAALRQWRRNVNRQKSEMHRLATRLRKLSPAVPLIVGGDFNIPDTSPAIAAFQADMGLADTFRPQEDAKRNSWDGGENRNVLFSSRRTDRLGAPLHGYELLTALYDSRPRRIDYLFHSRHFPDSDVRKGAWSWTVN